jgi:hypothetical protein
VFIFYRLVSVKKWFREAALVKNRAVLREAALVKIYIVSDALSLRISRSGTKLIRRLRLEFVKYRREKRV